MKNKLMLLIFLLVAFIVILSACGESAATSGEIETTAPIATTAPTTTKAVVTTEKPLTTTPFETTESAPITTTVQTPETQSPLEGMDAKQILDFATQKMAALEGFDAEMIEGSIYGEEDSRTEMRVKVNLANGKTGYIGTKIDEEGTTVDMIYVDGVVYVDMKMTGMSLKYKSTDVSLTSGFEELFAMIEKEDDEDDSEKIESIKLLKSTEGVYTIEVVATEEAAIETLLKSYADFDIDSSMFTDVSLVEVYEINAAGYVVITSSELSYTVEGERCQDYVKCQFNQAGELPEITVPDDIDSYMDMDEME